MNIILEIEHHFFTWESSSYRLLLPSFTPDRWFECDLFGLTKAGYAVEYEIKISRADFFADFKKANYDYSQYPETDETYRYNVRPKVGKHDMLNRKVKHGPSRFYFILPRELVAFSEIPEYAGWYEFETLGGRLRMVKMKAAPILHREKFPEKEIARLRENMYYRYWHERNERRQLSRRLDRARP